MYMYLKEVKIGMEYVRLHTNHVLYELFLKLSNVIFHMKF